ncbi:MAG: CvpA family protein [Rhodospirillales bacterium]|nr:CvpA family protein [Rhodospirillales bacterium]
MNTLDLIVLGIIGISGLFAFARGFVREALSIGAWVASAFVAIYGFSTARPIARDLIGNPTVADIAAGAVLFLGALVILTLATAALASRVKGSSLSALDRTLGFVFGLVRGAVLACLAWMVLAWAWPESDWPDWAQKARLKPFLAAGAETIRNLVPGQIREKSAAAAKREAERARDEAAERAIRALVAPAGPPSAGQASSPGYKPSQRREMDRLFQATE